MTENPYSKLDETGVKEQLALFKEALEGKENIDLYTAFALDKPVEVTEDEKTQFAALEKNSDTLSQISKILGGSKDSKNSTVEPSPAEKELLIRQEKLEKSALADKVSEIKSINSEFDATGIEELDIPTSEKLTVMGQVKEIVTKYQSGYDKLKAELTGKDAGTQTTKLATDSKDTSDGPDNAKEGAGKDIVAKFASRYGYQTKTKNEDTK